MGRNGAYQHSSSFALLDRGRVGEVKKLGRANGMERDYFSSRKPSRGWLCARRRSPGENPIVEQRFYYCYNHQAVLGSGCSMDRKKSPALEKILGMAGVVAHPDGSFLHGVLAPNC